MPFRFRKSIKILPGIKLNLSKSGISTSVGKKGATINFGKRGARATVGIPGTGLSYSSQTSAPKTTSPHLPSSQPPSQSQTNNPKSGCLPGIFNLITIPFRVLADFVKSISNPQTRRSTIMLAGSVLGSCFLCIVSLSVINATGILNTPTPTIDLASIQKTAQAGVFKSFTQTALALPTSTFTITFTPTITSTPTDTNTPAPTYTASLTNTTVPTNTNIPVATVYIPPAPPPPSGHPSGTSGQCADGKYTTAQHKQGACSHHGGLSTWWGP